MSRADRVAEQLGERELDLLLVTDLVNVRYLTGFTGSNAMAVVGRDVRRFVTDFRYVEQAAARGPRLRPRAGPAGLRHRAGRRLAGGRAAGRASRTSTSACAPTSACAAWSRTGSSWSPPAGSSRRCARSRSADEIERIATAAALTDEIYGVLREQGLVGRTRARGGARARERDAPPRRRARLHVDRRLVRARRAAARAAGRRADRARDAGDARHRRAARRLLLGLHAHVGHRRAAGRPRRGLRARPARAGGGAGRRPARPRGPRGRRRGARHHRGRRPRRALRPRARPRRRARGPRGAAAGAHRRGRAGGRQRRHGRAGRVPAGPRRGADRGSRRGRRRTAIGSSPAPRRTSSASPS